MQNKAQKISNDNNELFELLKTFTSNTIEQIAKKSPESAKKAADFNDFRMILTKESDRSCAIMAAAFLESKLESIIELKLVENKKIIADVLRGHNAFLGSFASKIDMAFLLGLISKECHHDLNLLRKIRNEFAHHMQAINFETDNIRSHCNNLKLHALKKEHTSRKKFLRSMTIALFEIDYFGGQRIEERMQTKNAESIHSVLDGFKEQLSAHGYDASIIS